MIINALFVNQLLSKYFTKRKSFFLLLQFDWRMQTILSPFPENAPHASIEITDNFNNMTHFK